MDILLIFLLLICLVISLFAFSLSISFFMGPPFVPTPKNIVKEMLSLLNAGGKDTLLDLGSGDGIVLIEAAKFGAKAIGYETNPFLVILSKMKVRVYGLSNKVEVKYQSYEKANLHNATIVFCYNLPKFMPPILKKITSELPKNSKIVSYKFPIPRLKLIKKTKSDIYLYTNPK